MMFVGMFVGSIFCVIFKLPFFHKVGPQTPVISVGGAHNSRFGNVFFFSLPLRLARGLFQVEVMFSLKPLFEGIVYPYTNYVF